jgi:hypothetical protein
MTCSILNRRGTYPVTEIGPMGKKSAVLSRDRAATREVLAFLGQGLREQYEAPQPPCERLAELVRTIEQSTSE